MVHFDVYKNTQYIKFVQQRFLLQQITTRNINLNLNIKNSFTMQKAILQYWT